MLAKIKNFVQKPSGSMPKHLQTALFVGVGSVILFVGLSSTKPPRNPQEVEGAKRLPSALDSNAARQFQKDYDQKPHPEASGSRIVLPPEEPERSSLEHRPEASDNGAQVDRRASEAPFAPVTALKITEDAPPVNVSQQSISQNPTPTPVSVGKAAGKKEAGEKLQYREGTLYRLTEGTLIESKLMNRLDGTFAGPVVTLVTTPVFSKDGQTLLIPKESQFLGKANAVDTYGQRRLLIGFHRLLLPNGYSVELEDLTGLNGIGQTGLKDKVNNHYAQLFLVSGAIGLLSGLGMQGTGSDLNADGIDRYRQGIVSSVGNSATQILDRFLNVLPTVTIREGYPMRVFLKSDMLFPEYQN